MPPIRVHVEYDHSVDPVEWQRKHAAGLVPNVLPYGFNHLQSLGFEVNFRTPSKSWIVDRVLGGVARRSTGGFEIVDSARDASRRSCDVAVCWTERSGIPAAIRSAIPGEPPVVMGSIWMTDPGAGYNRLGRRLIRRGIENAAGIWANSEVQLDVLERFGARRAQLQHLLNPGIDDEFWIPEQTGQQYGQVLAVGNDRHRDHPFLVRSMRKVQALERRSRLKLVTRQDIDVPPELGAKYHAVGHSELRTMYAQASVVAVALKPNIHVSGCTSILEALACERPVVVTDYPGIASYVDHGTTGLLVPPGDESAFATAISELLQDEDRAREMGMAGRRAVEKWFTSRQFMGQLAKVLRNVVNGG